MSPPVYRLPFECPNCFSRSEIISNSAYMCPKCKITFNVGKFMKEKISNNKGKWRLFVDIIVG